MTKVKRQTKSKFNSTHMSNKESNNRWPNPAIIVYTVEAFVYKCSDDLYTKRLYV